MIAAGVEATCAFWLDARAEALAADTPADDQWAIAQARRTVRERGRLDLIAELRGLGVNVPDAFASHHMTTQGHA